MIDWTSSESHYLLNPRLPTRDRELLASAREQLPELPGHIWILTSGTSTTGVFKWIALSKKAFLVSAAAVNRHLQAAKEDTWLITLPRFHVGGLSIFARAHLSGSGIKEHLDSWSPQHFARFVKDVKVTLTSLVPTQLYDLVQAEIESPPPLRAVVIGGGALNRDLFDRALSLGYPVMASYGMTEMCSQVATSSIGSLELRPLDHVQLRTDIDGYLCLKSESLLTGIAEVTPTTVKYIDPKHNGWYRSEDLGFVEGQFLHILGRQSDQIKVSGELVLVPRLQAILSSFLIDAVIVASSDARLGMTLSVVLPQSAMNQVAISAVTEFNKSVAPFERVERIYFVKNLPRTELGKIKTAELKGMLSLR